MFKGFSALLGKFEELKSTDGALHTREQPTYMDVIHVTGTQTNNVSTPLYTPTDGNSFHIDDIIVSSIGVTGSTSLLIEYLHEAAWHRIALVYSTKDNDAIWSHAFSSDITTDVGDGATNMLRMIGNVTAVSFDVDIHGHEHAH